MSTAETLFNLPVALIGIGGAVDVEFIGGTAYALITLVGADVGGGGGGGGTFSSGELSLLLLAVSGFLMASRRRTGDIGDFLRHR